MSEEPWRRTASSGSRDTWRRGTDEGWRSRPSGNDERPKLNLTKRETDKDVDKQDKNAEEEKEEKTEGDGRPSRQPRRFREPEVVNSRAAMLGEAAAPRKEVSRCRCATYYCVNKHLHLIVDSHLML
jgi:hypothetical protein